MVPVLVRSRCVRFFPSLKGLALAGRGFGALIVGVGLVGAGALAEETAVSEFGKDIQLAPFKVQGKPLSISIHARTKADRHYAERFADEVVEVAYETLGDSTGRGLVIVGAKGEPHPYYVYRKFLELARARKISPTMVKSAHELDGKLTQWKLDTRMDEKSRAGMDLDFDTVVKALPMPLEGAASTLYQLAWSEGFDDARMEQRLMTLTRDDLARDDLKRYDWVFYLPPSDVTAAALKEIVNKGMAKEKMGLFKRAAIRSALVIFSPAVKKGVEGMRKGVLFMTVLRAQGTYGKEDIDALTRVYVQELMPDFKPGSGDEKRRALAAIERQKIANAEYAKDPFVKPERLATYDPAAYAPFLGEYTAEPPKVTHWFKREGDGFQWSYKERRPRPFYPAGDRLLVSEDGRMTIQFLVDDTGTVTGVEERRARHRQTIPRKL
jgi:hypothetical protein